MSPLFPVDGFRVLDSMLTNARRVSRELNTILAEIGLREDSWRTLLALEARPGMLMSDIAEALTVSNATVTRLVNDLVDEGSVYRKPGPDDGRSIVVHLSRQGRQRLARANALIEGRLDFTPIAPSFHTLSR
ncbi:hypothetical protein ASG56_06195 [Rhodococcus sp. Leaf7]|uniref:MarR family winged helix-turn-helix transcriptional regulator n=1 Tax=Rhodococcus sp. Leaf247 TaxID=1736307 RepID=UPI0006F9845B|nr:MarR family transcriptional regulator [Rhodococcus sp. Leaf247]KQU07131.1 hypothetical protein ASG56_06195 [Rhodococcus sp. Leaf7]KQU42649.1 hypothetical protein ASG64_06195 [Rhodococcus sp. Leaf247]